MPKEKKDRPLVLSNEEEVQKRIREMAESKNLIPESSPIASPSKKEEKTKRRETYEVSTKTLAEQFVERERQKEVNRLLALLPQGAGSGLNADMLDDLHAQDIIERAIAVARSGGLVVSGLSKYVLEVHGADKHDHTVWYAVITPSGAILPESNPADLQKITGAHFTYYVLDFDKATAEIIFAQFKLPPNYTPGASLEVVIEWLSTLTTGAVKWGAQILGRGDGESFDAALSTEQTVTTTTNGTAGSKNVSTITIASPALTAEDTFVIKIRRVAADGADTMDADARMVMTGVRL